MNRPLVHVLGAGRAARVVLRWLADRGQIRVGQVLNRRLERARAAVEFIGQGEAVSRFEALAESDWLLVGLPDDHMRERVQKRLADCWDDCYDDCYDDRNDERRDHSRSENRSGPALAFHLSGSLRADVLDGVAGQLASVHPARAFANADAALAAMPGTWFTGEGHPAALARLAALIEAAGGRWQSISPQSKPTYHAATVVASNYLVALPHLARSLAESAGLPPSSAAELIRSLQQGSLSNLDQASVEQALTGPIERGDGDRVASLQAAMEVALDSECELLRALGAATLRIAVRARGERAEDEAIRALFSQTPASAPD